VLIYCEICVGGKFAAAGASSCTTCMANTYAGAGSSVCTDCRANSQAPSGSTSAAACLCKDRYLEWPQGGTQCVFQKCEAGQQGLIRRVLDPNYNWWQEIYISWQLEEECRPCGAGRYSSEAGTEVCSYCPVGKYTDRNSVGQNDIQVTSCTDCPKNMATELWASSGANANAYHAGCRCKPGFESKFYC